MTRRFVAVLMFALLALLVSPVSGAGKLREHRVARGNTIGKLAKRYAITVDALCYANDIDAKAEIKIGQKLLIPPKDDEGGKETRKVLEKRRASKKGDSDSSAKKGSKRKRSKRKSKRGAKKSSSKNDDAPRWHKVYRRQNLGSIARRYNTSVQAIVHANDIQKKEPIHPGQMLIIPPKEDEDGARTRKVFEASDGEPPVEEEAAPTEEEASGWKKYRRPAKKKGYITILGKGERGFKGYLVNHKRQVTTKAKKAMKALLATSGGEEHDMDLRLLRLLADVSDTFGGRPIRVVSGYRTGTTSATSRHRHGRAIDFIVVGVPNTALRDFVKTLDDVGVGYYPNSSFIHMDVRKQWTFWIDYSGPGQRPRYGGFWTRRPKS